MRKRARVDANQAAIVQTLRAIGASVESLAPLGNGVPDLLVGYHGANYLLEVKKGKGKKTPDQDTFTAAWRGKVTIVRTPDEAMLALYGIAIQEVRYMINDFAFEAAIESLTEAVNRLTRQKDAAESRADALAQEVNNWKAWSACTTPAELGDRFEAAHHKREAAEAKTDALSQRVTALETAGQKLVTIAEKYDMQSWYSRCAICGGRMDAGQPRAGHADACEVLALQTVIGKKEE